MKETTSIGKKEELTYGSVENGEYKDKPYTNEMKSQSSTKEDVSIAETTLSTVDLKALKEEKETSSICDEILAILNDHIRKTDIRLWVIQLVFWSLKDVVKDFFVQVLGIHLGYLFHVITTEVVMLPIVFLCFIVFNQLRTTKLLWEVGREFAGSWLWNVVIGILVT